MIRGLLTTLALSPLLLASSGAAGPVVHTSAHPMAAVQGSPPVSPSGGPLFGLGPQPPARADSIARPEHEFYWTRAIFSGPLLRGLSNGEIIVVPGWAADYPKSDEQLTIILNRLLDMDTAEQANAVPLDDPSLRRFPMIYAAEVGLMDMTPSEIEGLRSYLEAGGFLMVDDFWGNRDWFFFRQQMELIFPDRPMEQIPIEHPIFHQLYEIDEVKVVPNLDNLRAGRLYECEGCVSEVHGIFDDDGRLMVLANYNTDLGDAWEWAESPDYPLTYSTYASQIVVNTILYVMTH